MLHSGDIVNINGAKVTVGTVAREYDMGGERCIEFEATNELPYILGITSSDIKSVDKLSKDCINVSRDMKGQIGNIVCCLEDNGVNMYDAFVYISRDHEGYSRLVSNGNTLVASYDDALSVGLVTESFDVDLSLVPSFQDLVTSMKVLGREVLLFPCNNKCLRVDNAVMLSKYDKYKDWLDYVSLSHMNIVVNVSYMPENSVIYFNSELQSDVWKFKHGRCFIERHKWVKPANVLDLSSFSEDEGFVVEYLEDDHNVTESSVMCVGTNNTTIILTCVY